MHIIPSIFTYLIYRVIPEEGVRIVPAVITLIKPTASQLLLNKPGEIVICGFSLLLIYLIYSSARLQSKHCVCLSPCLLITQRLDGIYLQGARNTL